MVLTMVLSNVMTVVLVVALSYYLYVPFPDHASDRWGKSLSATASKVRRLLTVAGETIGVDVEVSLARFWDGVTADSADDLDIEYEYIDLDGVGGLLHRPKAASTDPLPCIVYYHGGGWIAGSTASYKGFTSYLATLSQSIVISVEYRLAPEHTFPVPFEDSLKATRHILLHADKYGVDADKIALAGDENGGTLALTVALNISKEFTRKKQDNRIRLVGCFYSPMQIFDFNLPSYVKHGDGPGMLHKTDIIRQHLYHLYGYVNRTLLNMMSDNRHTSSEMKRSEAAEIFTTEMIPFSFRSSLPPDWIKQGGNEKLAVSMRSVVLDYRLSPMLASDDDLDILPPTYFINSEFNPLRDESLMFYGYVREIEPSKRIHMYYRTEQHGFLRNFRSSSVASGALDEFMKQFRLYWKHKDI